MIHPQTTILNRRLKKIHADVKVVWEDTSEGAKVDSVKIIVDTRKDPIVSLVLHELVHAWFLINLEVPLDDVLEEKLVLALENTLFEYLLQPSHEKELQSWTKAIERKL